MTRPKQTKGQPPVQDQRAKVGGGGGATDTLRLMARFVATFVVTAKALCVVVVSALLTLPSPAHARSWNLPGKPRAEGALTRGLPGKFQDLGRGQEPAPLPCPRAATPVIAPPSRPEPPPSADPAHRMVGGDQLATPGLVIPAGAAQPPAVTATSWLVADLDSGEVLGGCGPHEYGTPASVQKLLLAATLLGKLDPQQVITVTDEDLQFEPGSSAAGLVSGGRYTVENLWLGLLLVSGNDAANVLARLGGGGAGLEGGVQAMNDEAKRLGAMQTHAVTPSGLDGPGQFTSAYDLALIARECFAYSDFRRYSLLREATMPAQPHAQREAFQMENQNRLIDNYPGGFGGKTGFTDLSRHTYVGAAERGGRRLVVTVLGAESVPLQGWQQGAALLDWGFALPSDASVGKLVDPGQSPRPSPTGPADGSLMAAGGGKLPPLIAILIGAAVIGLALFTLARRRRKV